ncbi:MAG: IS200/IS605 family transposase [Muribaculaceae bacterium]|nr:IS200/IS605 family transposase [Muribaculaceae bacterium]
MANTYTQIYLHLVFAVSSRMALITSEWQNDLYRYMAGAFQQRGHKILAIGGMPDHIHILIGYKITDPIPNMVQSIKLQSSKWINEHRLSLNKFAWQSGYGVFSYSRDRIDQIIKYINNQEKHHRTKPFMLEYQQILSKCDIEYKSEYIFSPIFDTKSHT